MIYKRVYFDAKRTDASLLTYAPKAEKLSPRDAILVVPGGGYHTVCAEREGEPIALAYVSRGMSAFVLNYTVIPKSKDEPLLEAAAALAHIRKNAASYNVNPDRIFVIGFSAGGHLVGTLSTRYKKAEELLGLPENSARPTGTVYCYPVVTAMCETHQGSYVNLLGKPFDEISEQEKREYSNELHVTDLTPPAFIWHTATDQTVPVYGSLRLAESYVRAGALVELRIFPNGPHGMALATEHTSCGVADYIDEHVSEWLEDSLKWMKSIS